MELEGGIGARELRGVMNIFSACPMCGEVAEGIFPVRCPAECGFAVDHLAGNPVSEWGRRKWEQHSGLLRGEPVQPYGKDLNSSFHPEVKPILVDLLRWGITFGDRGEVPARGGHRNQVIPFFVGFPTGLAVARQDFATTTCSGIVIVSAQSMHYGHTFPAIYPWVERKFSGVASHCRACLTPTSFGIPFCETCYSPKSLVMSLGGQLPGWSGGCPGSAGNLAGTSILTPLDYSKSDSSMDKVGYGLLCKPTTAGR